MTPDNINESTDLANLRLKLRGGLTFELQEHGQTRCYVIHDETSSNYFQIGIPEYAFLSVLDGNTNLQQAIEETAYRLGDEALTIREAVRVSHWLIESGLANAIDDAGTVLGNWEHLIEQSQNRSQQKIVSQLNPLFIRFPLGNPQRLIRSLTPAFGWIGSKSFFAIWLSVVAFAAFCLFQRPEGLAGAAQGLLTSNSWIWMLVTLVGLKVIHELAHGLFCHRFGGSVKETGVVCILLIPMPYVDVTSCWSFSSKWKRIAVAAAGMYVEIFLAAAAAIAWSFSNDPVLKFHLFNVMLLGSLSTVLFNANFLMRFDGYYIFSDLLEIPNLYQKGQQFVNGLGRRFLLGMKHSEDPETTSTRTIIRAYGVAALVWRVIICVSLTIVAMAMFHGFGIALAMTGVVLWVGTPVWRFISRWLDPAADGKPNIGWVSMVTMPLAVSLALAMLYVPWPVQVSAPAIVEYETPAVIRADAAGFVKAIYVTAGQTVSKGDLLVELENRELESRLVELKLERQKSAIRSRSFHRDREIAAYQSENATIAAIANQIAELEQKKKSLTLVASADGFVIGEDLETLPGQFITSGATILQVVDEKQKKITASVSQDDFEVFTKNKGLAAVFVPVHGGNQYAGTLNTVQPTATSTADVRLTSYAGGSLAVRPPNPNRETNANQTNDSLELISSRFTADVGLGDRQPDELRVGTVGWVRLEQYDETIAERLVVTARRWLNGMFKKT